MRATMWCGVALAVTVLGACEGPRATDPAAADMVGPRATGRADDAAFAFGPTAAPYGHDMIHWSQRWWKWAERVPASENPLVDSVGQTCVNGQRGRVWNLPVLIAPATSGTRACTIPNGKALVVNLSGVWNDYPCPDTSFHPAPGQSLYAFLIQGAAPIVGAAHDLTLTVDGQSLPNPTAYRFTSRALTYFTGSTTLDAVLDPCITGRRQAAISDGYFVMIKPLAPGRHVISSAATDPAGTTAVTYDLTVRGDSDGDDGDDDP
ncbi:MAG TPA: hypothetical protein VNW46_05460 [Gemmatimonadaceae bacterium]|jgi:hypothetical protein|nr:hypothetical protein [Gemmatimonadaceae bacterium]